MPTLPLFPDFAAAPLVGIARLAAHAIRCVKAPHRVLSLPAVRSLSSKIWTPAAFPVAINPYRMRIRLKYCLRRYTHEFMELRDPLAFEQKIYVKQQAAWLLRQGSEESSPR